MKSLLPSNILWVAVGGMCGAWLRYGTNSLFSHIAGETSFLTATTIENILGSFLMGILYTILSKQSERNARLNLFLLTGLLGSYTTYSGFMTEALLLYSDSFLLFTAYIFSQVTVGITLLLIGIRVTRKFV
ncbi:fluoride efflux transporter CrcB [soil metagenome]